MVDKTIKAVLKKKIKEWANSVEDEKIKNIILKKTIITGGAIVSLFNNEQPKDYDVYMKDKASCLAIAQYYVNKFNEKHGAIKNKIGHNNKAFVLDGDRDLEEQLNEQGYGATINGQTGESGTRNWGSHMLTNLDKDRVKIIIRSDGVASENDDHLEEPFEDVYDTLNENDTLKDPVDIISDADDIPAEALDSVDGKEKYRPVFLSSNAITLSNKIQIIVRFYGNAETIHSTYDFLHCTSWYDSEKENLNYTPECLRAIMEKQLVYMGSKYPLCSVIRTRKFIKRGWNINAGQYLKMMFQISELDLTDIAVLEDQLVGVDSAYFMQLIDALKKKMDADNSFTYNTNYVTTIIDRIFS